MSKIKNGGLDQYGVEPFEQQQFGAAGVEGVNCDKSLAVVPSSRRTESCLNEATAQSSSTIIRLSPVWLVYNDRVYTVTCCSTHLHSHQRVLSMRQTTGRMSDRRRPHRPSVKSNCQTTRHSDHQALTSVSSCGPR